MHKKSNITGARYVLAVKDLQKSVDYYKQKLGFETDWAYPGWHQLSREKFIVMLGECPDDRSAFETHNHAYFAYIDIENIDDLYHEYVQKDIEIIKHVKDEPWGQREFAIRTIDGHRVMFGEHIGESIL